jgi:acyl-coenzyme A thioesterase PaaI-like protein
VDTDLTDPAGDDLLAAATDLGTALRGLVAAGVATTVDAAELRAAAAAAREITGRLAVSLRTRDQLPPVDDLAQGRRTYNPVGGDGNPLAPPLRVRAEGDGVVAEVTLGLVYEGPPTLVHGGVSALMMDQLLAVATADAGLWGMTARLELDYRRPVPLEVPLVLRARISENTGRKTIATGTIARADDPDQTLLEARGVFVTPRPATSDAGREPDRKGRGGQPTDATAPAG